MVVPTTPVVAPAAPPAPAPAVQQTPPVTTPVTPTSPTSAYNPGTGDAVVDLAVQNFSRAFSVSGEVFKQAVQPALDSGDIGRLDHAALLKAGGAEAAVQAVELVRALSGAMQARAASVAEYVHTTAGGKENWVASVTHFNASQPDFVKEQFLNLLQSGDRAKMDYAAKHIVQLAQQAGVVAATLAVQPGGGTVGNTSALSNAEFVKELNALRSEAKNNSLESGPYAERYHNLLERRAAGRQLGK